MSHFIVSEELEGQRLDKIFHRIGLPSRSQWKVLIDEGSVTVNHQHVKAGYVLKPNDLITYELRSEEGLQLEPKDLSLDVLYEDDAVAVIYKPLSLSVHPGAGNESVTLVHGLLHRFKELPIDGGEDRPGIVHRLDKETDGLLVVAKTSQALKNLQREFSERTVRKSYVALVEGYPEKTGEIVAPIGRDPLHRKKMAVVPQGKFAHTKYRLIKKGRGVSLLDVEIFTGRTHQIRVHLASVGHAIVGDQIYGRSLKNEKVQYLTARKIGFFHPTKDFYVEVEIPIPHRYAQFLEFVERKSF